MTTALERASLVAKFVELRSISLAGANVTTAMRPLRLPSSLEIQSRYRSAHDATSEDNHLLVTIDFEFEGTDVDAPEKPAVRLDATYLLVYALKPDAEYPENAEADFARLNGAYNCWPYWREMVQTVCGRVGLSGIIIPVFRAKDFELRFKTIPDSTSSKGAETSRRGSSKQE